jgi:hypothetical protein
MKLTVAGSLVAEALGVGREACAEGALYDRQSHGDVIKSARSVMFRGELSDVPR